MRSSHGRKRLKNDFPQIQCVFQGLVCQMFFGLVRRQIAVPWIGFAHQPVALNEIPFPLNSQQTNGIRESSP